MEAMRVNDLSGRKTPGRRGSSRSRRRGAWPGPLAAFGLALAGLFGALGPGPAASPAQAALLAPAVSMAGWPFPDRPDPAGIASPSAPGESPVAGPRTTPEEASVRTLSPLAGRIIVLDPGHGGIDGGAVGLDGRAVEKTIVLEIAEALRDYLHQAGALVWLTREEDRMLDDESGRGTRKERDLRARMVMINAPGVEAALSLHLNSFPSSRTFGAETFYAGVRPENRCLAALLQESLREATGSPRGIKRGDDLYVLRTMEPPGALVELGYLSHPEEARRLVDPAYQRRLAAALYVGLWRYFARADRACSETP
ncbi:hypothetical protein SA87_02085 [Hydrogenibacillus schlegelii]|uniref:MurNAc-LAA domain-containing protein n=1 Tax=Hydrogenibacillus schlegelii TaxID=1484 RepID=A0A179IS50_HYDSH|nr:hypothetical protein SA87_02085 [Hydrogenibacillus schlegelii]